MTGRRPDNHRGQARMQQAIRKRARRREAWEEEGERPIWRNLSMIGALGWLIVAPTLLGVLLGRWLDEQFDSGIFYTAALIFAGVTFGCYLAWQRIDRS